MKHHPYLKNQVEPVLKKTNENEPNEEALTDY
jgi:hypothetical protein